MSLGDLANLATIVIGVCALLVSLWFGVKANQVQRVAFEQGLENELGDVVDSIVPTVQRYFAAGDLAAREAVHNEWGMPLRTAAFRADRIVRRLPAERVGVNDLGHIAQAFGWVGEASMAAGYFERMERAAVAGPRSVLRAAALRTAAEHFVGYDRDRGRRTYELALEPRVEAHIDYNRAFDVETLLMWARSEWMLGDVVARDALAARARALFGEISPGWHRDYARLRLPNFVAAAGLPPDAVDDEPPAAGAPGDPPVQAPVPPAGG